MPDEQEKNETEHQPICDCQELKKQVEEFKSGWQRAVADYKNLQKETAERRQEWAAFSDQQILEDFIPVYDNFKLAFRLQTTDYSPEQKKWVDGIGHIMKQFGDILKAHNVVEIKTVGEKFDAKLHESAGEEESDQESGMILREVGGGYTMGGRVIKVARVVIAK